MGNFKAWLPPLGSEASNSLEMSNSLWEDLDFERSFRNEELGEVLCNI